MQTVEMGRLDLPSRETIPALGQGTWHFAERADQRQQEIAALRLGLDLGMTLVDTAEMYADGAAEELVGEAIAGRREQVFLVSKVLPENASRRGTITACERSLRRLKTDWLDLYLLHWRGVISLEETLLGFGHLLQSGLIRYWGVSNFDVTDMQELLSLPGGAAVATNQVLYNLSRRGSEWDLLPWCQQRGIPIMAYSPVEQGRLLHHVALRTVGERHGATSAQVALAWVISHDGVNAIPRASRSDHVRDNRAAANIQLSPDDLALLDSAFPPPTSKRPLEML